MRRCNGLTVATHKPLWTASLTQAHTVHAQYAGSGVKRKCLSGMSIAGPKIDGMDFQKAQCAYEPHMDLIRRADTDMTYIRHGLIYIDVYESLIVSGVDSPARHAVTHPSIDSRILHAWKESPTNSPTHRNH